MRPVQLTRKLVLETPARVPDGAGGHAESWTATGTVWADLRAGSGRRDDAGGLDRARVAYRVILRAAPPGSARRPRAGQRLRGVDGRVFRIAAVAEDDPAGRYLTCFATEEAPA
ncbi:head-tail adaptor protein [Rhodovulum sp. YNF3179]|uniref:head-tail adaptor protein n=1 Tax=Rhodovulum sp. YNF3179 TaxID=3425127 RepID=UPI003D3365A2